MNITGNLVITKENAEQYANVVSVAGYVDVCKGASFTAPALTKVAGSVYVCKGASFTAPALTEVAGYVDVLEGASFTAPALTEAGYVYVLEGASFTAPALTHMYNVKGKIISINQYVLWKSDSGLYYAGCKRGLTKDQCIALAETWEEKDIAKQFIAAILESEK